MIKKSILKIAILSLFCPLVVQAEKHPQSTPVTVEKVSYQNLSSSLDEVGKLSAKESAVLSFNVSEKITAIHFKDGERVTKGDVIAQLDDATAKADLDKSTSSLALASSKLERVKALLKKQPDSMSKQDVDELNEQVNLAKADVRQKQAIVNNYKLVAPFTGNLTHFAFSIGSRIDASAGLVSIVKLDPIEVQYSIDQSDMDKAHLEQSVRIKVDAFGDETFIGTVNYIAPRVDESSGRVDVHAYVDNSDHRLAPGMFAKIEQNIAQDSKALVVSQNAIQAKGDERYVWVVESDQVKQQQVILGANKNNGYAVVESGLKYGEQVVITGQQNLTSESKVNIIESKSVKSSAIDEIDTIEGKSGIKEKGIASEKAGEE